MSAFGIFALILTTAYIIYFSVMLAKDIYSSRKTADTEAGSEVFELPADVDSSVMVTETEDGFIVGATPVQALAVRSFQEDEQSILNEGLPTLQAQDYEDELDRNGMDVALDVVHQVQLNDQEYHELLQGNNGLIDNGSNMVTRIPAEEPLSADTDNEQGRDRM